VPVDREAGLAAYAAAEPVEHARARLAAIAVTRAVDPKR